MFNEGRFDGGLEGEQNAISSVPEKKFTQQELRDRYEGPYREEQARKLWSERQRIRGQEEARKQQLLVRLGKIEESFTEGASYIKTREAQIVSYHDQILQELSAKREKIEQQKNSRGLLAKIKHLLTGDPLTEQIKDITQQEEGALLAIAKAGLDASKLLTEEEERKNSATYSVALSNEGGVEQYQENKKDLLRQTRDINQESKLATSTTLEDLNQGSLDISRLAIESNALVVHTIPLDGWSMKNTSMNNKEVDTTSMQAQEKAEMLFQKSPDVSASVLSAGQKIEGQNMFYPFGYIVDGKVIASFEGDEGTYADGNVRRRKEAFHGTLQTNTKEQFKKVATSSATESIGGQYNETIVHQPRVKGILLDEIVLGSREDLGDTIVEYYPGDQQAQIEEKYSTSIVSQARGVPSKGEYSGKDIYKISRKRTAIQKAVDYAKRTHPELPVYIRKLDGIYTLDGKKVDANAIYGN